MAIGSGFAGARLKPATLVAATFLSLFGSLGQFFAVESWDDIAKARGEEQSRLEHSISVLRELQVQYFNSYVQANLLFAMNPQDVTQNQGLTAQMYKLALVDRASPMRAMMAELSNAGAFKFTEMNAKYDAVRRAAGADLSYANYTALNAFEKSLIDMALDKQHEMQDRLLSVADEKTAAEEVRDKRRYWLVIITSLGTLLLLAANLINERTGHGAVSAPGGHGH